MDFSKQLPRFLLVIILSMDGILAGLIFSNFALNFNTNGMGWDKISNFLGYAFLGFLGGLLIGVVLAVSLNKKQLKGIFRIAAVLILFLLVYVISTNFI